MNKRRYRFWATLLDAYTTYRNAQYIWEKYWGWSDNPRYTLEEFEQKSLQDLLDSLNRVEGAPIEVADRGTCFNEIIDCIILNRPTKREDMTIKADNMKATITATLHGFTFEFPIAVCKEFASRYTMDGARAVPQFKCEGVLHLPTADVTLYGYIDELMPFGIHDIKTTGSYEVGKYKGNWQHKVYPYCMAQMGDRDVQYFQYDVLEINGKQFNTYTEHYKVALDVAEIELGWVCSDLIEFIKEHRNEIKNENLFK